MPKIVDHDARRRELVEATWRIIARLGLERATLREVAAEAGFANGALKPYFPTKAELVQATFEYVFGRTNARVAAAIDGATGLAALRAFALEVLPLDEDRRDEARVVLPFWQAAIHDPAQAATNSAAMLEWRRWVRGWLRQARDAGEVPGRFPVDAAGEAFLTFLLGAQVVAVLDADFNTPDALEGQLDAQLDLFRSSSTVGEKT